MRKTILTILQVTAILTVIGLAFIAWPGSTAVLAAITTFDATVAKKGILAAIRAVVAPFAPLVLLAAAKVFNDTLTEFTKRGVIDKMLDRFMPKEEEEKKEKSSALPPSKAKKSRKARRGKRTKRRR